MLLFYDESKRELGRGGERDIKTLKKVKTGFPTRQRGLSSKLVGQEGTKVLS